MRVGRRLMLGSVLLSAVVGCQRADKSLPAKPTGPDPELTSMMQGNGSPGKVAPGEKASASDVVPPPPPAVIASQQPAAPAADVRVVDFKGLESEIAKLQGKTVVVDCWATWCSICKEKFPKYLALQSKHAAVKDWVFATLANDPKDKADDVKAFLDQSNAKMICFVLDEDPADFAAHFDVNGVPAYLIYSPEGKLIYKAGKIEELEQELDRITKSP